MAETVKLEDFTKFISENKGKRKFKLGAGLGAGTN